MLERERLSFVERKNTRVNNRNKRGGRIERKIEYASFVTTVVRLVCRSVMPATKA